MENKSRKITLGATGDILLHKRVFNKAKKADGSGYDFSELLGEAKLFENSQSRIDNSGRRTWFIRLSQIQ